MASRARERLVGPLLAICSLLLVLLVVEVALRLTGFRAGPRPTVRRMVDARWRLLLDCFPSNPRGYFDIDLRRAESRERYFHLAPHRYDWVARQNPWAVESRYNTLRFRDRELGPKPAGMRRVMLLGDSFTEGEGVKEHDTCARALERILAEGEPGRWEVRNCGRRGADFPELYEVFESLLPYEPDLVVYMLVLNDADQPAGFRARQRYINDWILERGRPEDEAPPGPRSPLRPWLLDLALDRVRDYRIGRETTRWYLEMWGGANREGWQRTQGYLREMSRRLQLQRARLLVAPWPLFVALERGYPFAPVHETITRFCLREGIAHHDLLEVFRGRPTASLWVHPLDRHPNERAHRLAAQSLAPVVRRLLRD